MKRCRLFALWGIMGVCMIFCLPLASSQPNSTDSSSMNQTVLTNVHVDDVLELLSHSGANLVADTYVELNVWRNVSLAGKSLRERIEIAAHALDYEVSCEGEGRAYIWQYRQWFLRDRLPPGVRDEIQRQILRSHPKHLSGELKVTAANSPEEPTLEIAGRSVLAEDLIRQVAQKTQAKMKVKQSMARRRLTLFVQGISLTEFRAWVAKALRARWQKEGTTYILTEDPGIKREEEKAYLEYERKQRESELTPTEKAYHALRNSLLETLTDAQIESILQGEKLNIPASALSSIQLQLVITYADCNNQILQRQGDTEYLIDPSRIERLEMMLSGNNRIYMRCYSRTAGGVAICF